MPTMTDVARKAGISRPTVSLVLNGRADDVGICTETKEKILRAAEKLGYRRNELARAVVTGKSNFIGYLSRDISREYESRPLKGIVAEAEKRGYFVKIFIRPDGEPFARLLEKIIGQRPAGLVCRSLDRPETGLLLRECGRFGIPVATIGSGFRGGSGIRVQTDDEAGAEAATGHLARLGHKKIAFVCGPKERGFVELRLSGYLAAMKKRGLPVGKNCMIFSGDLDEVGRMAAKMLKEKDRPTAVFCGGDNFATAVIRAARKLGLHVPKDLSVAGYGGLGLAELCDPPLTTVEEPFEKVGALACGMLLDEIKSRVRKSFKKELFRKVGTRLVTRESTTRRKDAR